MTISLEKIGSYISEIGAEITAYDPDRALLYIVSGDTILEVLDFSDPSAPTQVAAINIADFGAPIGGANSVAYSNGRLAVALESENQTDNGVVALVDIEQVIEQAIGAEDLLDAVKIFTVGALPDMVTFTPDGSKVLVANEGEPGTIENADGSESVVDPDGSISIIDVLGDFASLGQDNVATADFSRFNGQEADLRAGGVRIFPDATTAQDVEPEYIAVSPDGTKAFVTLQENNAIAIVDIASATVENIQPLGLKDFSLEGNGLDASDLDGVINIQPQLVFGLYMPDSIAAFESNNGEVFYVIANEGDDRGDADEAGRGDAIRLKDLADVVSFGRSGLALDESFGESLLEDEVLGRLTISSIDGDTDGDGDIDQIVAYGGRSFSVLDANGNIVFDSGDQIARITAELNPELFNANDGDPAEFDARSDNKGAEPEAITTGVINGVPYAFVGLERAGGGVLVYELSDPRQPEFIQYIRSDADIAPEGLTFVAAEDSRSGKPLLTVANEGSNTVAVYEVVVPTENFTLQLLHLADQEAGIPALDDAPRASAVLNALRDDYANTLTLSSGDAIIPGLFFSASEEAYGGAGRADILIQNELGIQAIAFGNHEFDLGTGLVQDLIAGGEDDLETPDIDESFGGTLFPYLSSNLDFSTSPDLANLVVADDQAPLPNSIAATTVIDVNGEKIGIVGATTPTLPIISSPGDVTILPGDFDGAPTSAQLDALAAEIQKDVDEMLAANPGLNKVVVLSHMQQISIEQALATRLTNVDVIVAGGSNTRLFDEGDRPRAGDSAQGIYPIFSTDADGKPVAIVNTDGNYKYIGRLVVEFDAAGNIIPESYDASVSGAYATDEQGVVDLGAEGLIDPDIQAIVDTLEAVIVAKESNVFGVSDVYLNGLRESVRTEETNLGNLTADANLAIAQQADASVVISLKNGGGIRDDIGQLIVLPGGTGDPEKLSNEAIPGVKPAGGISETDIANSLRFNNGLTLLTITAEELLAVIEHGIAASSLDDENTQGRFPQVAGIEFSFDLAAEPGDRVQSLVILDADGNDADVLVQNSELVGDATRAFRMVTLGFLAGGGDGYPFPTRDVVELAQAEDIARTGVATFAPDGSEQDALAEYLAANFGAANPFDAADQSRAEDERIQNLAFRDDTVIDGSSGGEPMATAIYTIQGSGSASALVDQAVTFEGVVTGDFQDGDADDARNLRGFYVQDVDGDGNSATSDGIFVFEGGDFLTDVAVGDVVSVTGTVAEFFGETQVAATAVVKLDGEGETPVLISPMSVDFSAVNVLTNSDGELIADLEQYEGMLVSFDEPLTVDEYFNYDRFGEIRLSSGDRPYQFAQLNDPSVEGYQAYLEDLARRSITLDDGRSIQNPDPLAFPAPGFSDANSFRGGDTVTGLAGNVRFSRGSGGSGDETYRIVTTADPTFVSQNPRPTSPADVSGRLKVASFNVLNYFTTLDTSGSATTNGSNPRGADNATEFDRQTEKLVNAVLAIDADVLGLVELENDFLPGSEGNAVEKLVEALNAIAGVGTYDWVNPGRQFVDVSDAISVGSIYKTASVEIAEGTNPAILTDNNLPEAFVGQTIFNGPRTNRAPLAVTFAEKSSGELFTIAINHFKSKGSVADGAGNVDIGDGQANNNAIRSQAAEALTAWLQSDPTGSGDRDVLILGDLNAYAKEDPIKVLEAAGYANLAEQFADGEVPYSFLFDGQLGTLDYAMANSALLSQVTGATEWHVNADEPDALDYNLDFGRNADLFNGENPYRNSDHDPLIVGLDLGDDVVIDPSKTLLGTNRDDLLEGGSGDDTLLGRNGNDTLLGQGGRDTLNGQNGRDQLFGGSGNDVLVGGNGKDQLFGGEADDLLLGDSGCDQLFGEAGDDALFGGNGNDTLLGGDGNDTLTGENGRDQLFGGNADDFLLGGNGRDLLFGEAGDDLLSGGRGKDLLVGGSGIDTAQYDRMQADYRVLGTADSFTVSGGGAGKDTLIGVEFLQFQDGLVAVADLFATELV